LNRSPTAGSGTTAVRPPVPERTPAKPRLAKGLPPTWAWVAEMWVDAHGDAAQPRAPGATAIFAVCVHEDYPSAEAARLKLMREVGDRFRDRVPSGTPSLWVFPGGFFGFASRLYLRQPNRAWPGFDPEVVWQGASGLLGLYPPQARVAFGADYPFGPGRSAQHVWVCWAEASGRLGRHVITGCQSDLLARVLTIGPIRTAFFACGEFTGSRNVENGRYHDGQVLSDPATQLSGCQLLVGLSHFRVPGSVYGAPGPRRIHQCQMERFASRGASVLAHHHGGFQTQGRPRSGHQSNWVIFRGGAWLPETSVTALPDGAAATVRGALQRNG
jgi:hypothetical protein